MPQLIEQKQTTTCRMVKLCHSFPSLRAAVGEQFDPHKLAQWASAPVSDGEELAAAFVLAVWNGSTPDAGGWWNVHPYSIRRFDAVLAMATWDYAHQSAFLTWCMQPFFP